MFSLAMEAQVRGRGVVGSTSNILSFIADHVSDAIKKPFTEPLKVAHPAIVCNSDLALCTHTQDKREEEGGGAMAEFLAIQLRCQFHFNLEVGVT